MGSWTVMTPPFDDELRWPWPRPWSRPTRKAEPDTDKSKIRKDEGQQKRKDDAE